MDRQQKRDLLGLAKFLREIPTSKWESFDINDVYGGFEIDKDKRAHKSCGTAACVAGYAAILYRTRKFNKKTITSFMGPDYDELFAERFGITHDESDYITFPGRYTRSDDLFDTIDNPTPIHAAEHIEEVVAKHGK